MYSKNDVLATFNSSRIGSVVKSKFVKIGELTCRIFKLNKLGQPSNRKSTNLAVFEMSILVNSSQSTIVNLLICELGNDILRNFSQLPIETVANS